MGLGGMPSHLAALSFSGVFSFSEWYSSTELSMLRGVGCQLLIKLHKPCDAVCLGHFGAEAVGCHDRLIIFCVSSSELRRHGEWVIKVCKRCLRVQCSGIKYALCSFLNPCLLLISRLMPRTLLRRSIQYERPCSSSLPFPSHLFTNCLAASLCSAAVIVFSQYYFIKAVNRSLKHPGESIYNSYIS